MKIISIKLLALHFYVISVFISICYNFCAVNEWWDGYEISFKWCTVESCYHLDWFHWLNTLRSKFNNIFNFFIISKVLWIKWFYIFCTFFLPLYCYSLFFFLNKKLNSLFYCWRKWKQKLLLHNFNICSLNTTRLIEECLFSFKSLHFIFHDICFFVCHC